MKNLPAFLVFALPLCWAFFFVTGNYLLIFISYFILIPAGFILGLWVLKKTIRLPSKGFIFAAGAGTALNGLLLVVPLFIILMVLVYEWLQSSYARSAITAGEKAYEAENRYHSQSGTYTTDLDDLLTVDESLLDNPNITFRFLHADGSGFYLVTTHSKIDLAGYPFGPYSWVFTEEENPAPLYRQKGLPKGPAW